MKKLVIFRLGLCAIELAIGVALLIWEKGFERDPRFVYFGISEPVTYGSFTLIQSVRLLCALWKEILPNDIDLVWTRTGMVMYTVSAWVQVVERKDLDRAGIGFGAALIFLFDQTVFFLNHPVPEYLLEPRPEPAGCEDEKAAEKEKEQTKALLADAEKPKEKGKEKEKEKGSCVKRAVVA